MSRMSLLEADADHRHAGTAPENPPPTGTGACWGGCSPPVSARAQAPPAPHSVPCPGALPLFLSQGCCGYLSALSRHSPLLLQVTNPEEPLGRCPSLSHMGLTPNSSPAPAVGPSPSPGQQESIPGLSFTSGRSSFPSTGGPETRCKSRSASAQEEAPQVNVN